MMVLTKAVVLDQVMLSPEFRKGYISLISTKGNEEFMSPLLSS